MVPCGTLKTMRTKSQILGASTYVIKLSLLKAKVMTNPRFRSVITVLRGLGAGARSGSLDCKTGGSWKLLSALLFAHGEVSSWGRLHY